MEENKAELKLIQMSEVEAEEVSWLWYPFIPYGKLTIIQGDPGDGTLTTDFPAGGGSPRALRGRLVVLHVTHTRSRKEHYDLVFITFIQQEAWNNHFHKVQ